MVLGFQPEMDFQRLIGWELSEVTIDKYHVMFFFNNNHDLLNIADSFSYRSADGSSCYTYEIYGERQFLDVAAILRTAISGVEIVSRSELKLVFETGCSISVFDNPRFRSWWFMPVTEAGRKFWISDKDLDELTDEETAAGPGSEGN
ncbi:hypothetical protein FHS78_002330 [Parvibaculum indicum]|uniref:hypothetical protein n=1 Tax=Parvibaculum indicum TaxID=562969 RepID=UPI001420CEE8|nr:hypothetical protein [Parvibaculum indicum]NIJ42039.1 hypothetical protein [Parvibaculum indicum]